MTTPSRTKNGMFNLTQEIAVDLFNPPPQEKKTGILDIQADSINTPPQFTEEETILAMKNLGITPNDLVLVSERVDDPINVSENSGMKIQMIQALEKKRLEAIEKIIAERDRIIMEGNIEVPIPKTIDDAQNEIEDQNDSQTTNKFQPPRKKKKGKSNLKSGNKKSKIKKKITNTENDLIYDVDQNSNARNTKRRRKKSSRSSVHKFQAQKSKEPLKSRSSLSQTQNQNNDKPSTNRRPSVAERRQKYNSKIPINNNSIKNHEGLHLNDRKNYIEYESNRKNDIMLVNIRVKANEERCRMEREEKQQLIKRQAQLRMQKQKDEETQFERMKKDKKSKAQEEMKRKERLYKRIQEKKMKALEQEKIRRQQKIYNNKVKPDENSENNEDRFSKLRQKLLEAQNKSNANLNANNNNNNTLNNDDDIDLFSVTQPQNPKILTVTAVTNSTNTSIKDGINNNNSISAKRSTNPAENNNDNKLPTQKIKAKPTTNAKPLLSSTLNPPPVKKPFPQQNPKSRSSLQSKNSAYYRQLLKLPVVGKNKTKIPCLHK